MRPHPQSGTPSLSLQSMLNMQRSKATKFYAYWRSWQPILANFMPTKDLGESMATHSYCICSCFNPISKNYCSCYVPKSIVLVSLQFPKCIVFDTFQKALFLFRYNFQNVSFLLVPQKPLFLFRSKIDHSFLASLWFVYIQHIT